MSVYTAGKSVGNLLIVSDDLQRSVLVECRISHAEV